MKFRTLTLLGLIFSVVAINAQEGFGTLSGGADSLLTEEVHRDVKEYVTKLTTEGEYVASVSVNIDPSASAAIDSHVSDAKRDMIDGYRVGIYFNNSSSARSGAMDVMAKCDSLYRDIIVTMSYDNPYFKVSAGYCTNSEEAIMMLHRIQRNFPKAYLMRERISIDQVIASRKHEVESYNDVMTLPSFEADHDGVIPN